ncbi:MAG: hypothetical protein CM1200mP15_11890 [Dehalococcoidia bacterium]|nr:MAG: hypothetical protein CM1200mP15_11890 [Dehalococcoidia bacterium]
MFKSVSSRVSFPDMEANVLKYWKDNNVFSLERMKIGSLLPYSCYMRGLLPRTAVLAFIMS